MENLELKPSDSYLKHKPIFDFVIELSILFDCFISSSPNWSLSGELIKLLIFTKRKLQRTTHCLYAHALYNASANIIKAEVYLVEIFSTFAKFPVILFSTS